MNFQNIVREASAALRRNWVRSVLTILGISVGVGAFICVVAIGNAGSSSIEKQLQNLGDNFIWVEAGSRAKNGVRYGARADRTLILADATAIVQQVPLIKAMSLTSPARRPSDPSACRGPISTPPPSTAKTR